MTFALNFQCTKNFWKNLPLSEIAQIFRETWENEETPQAHFLLFSALQGRKLCGPIACLAGYAPPQGRVREVSQHTQRC